MVRFVNPTTIPYSTEALQANLLRLQNEWETVQASRDRDAIYQYLNSIFELVHGGRRRARQSSVLIGRFACEGRRRSGNQNRLPL